VTVPRSSEAIELTVKENAISENLFFLKNKVTTEL
jgi:hypothetical protein